MPFTVKDIFDTAGVVTTAGLRKLTDNVPDRDATVVARMRAAGAILIGKTNCPPGGIGDDSWNSLHGGTRNPYNLDRSPGGSSSGEAAIIAAGGIADRHRQRLRRQHPAAGPLLRHRRAQADRRAGFPARAATGWSAA